MIRKWLAIGIILLFVGSSMPVLAQSEIEKEMPLGTSYYSVAFICGSNNPPVSKGLFHFTIYKEGFTPSLFFIGFDKNEHHLKVRLYAECIINGGLHLGIISKYGCCVLAQNVTVYE